MGGDRNRVRPSECGHDGTVLVSPVEDGEGRVARYLACGTLGPARETSEEAKRALENLGRDGRRDEGLAAPSWADVPFPLCAPCAARPRTSSVPTLVQQT